jgi:hypothetical protein
MELNQDRIQWQIPVDIVPQVTARVQKPYFVLIGGVTQMDEEPTWSNDAQIGETGQFAA